MSCKINVDWLQEATSMAASYGIVIRLDAGGFMIEGQNSFCHRTKAITYEQVGQAYVNILAVEVQKLAVDLGKLRGSDPAVKAFLHNLRPHATIVRDTEASPQDPRSNAEFLHNQARKARNFARDGHFTRSVGELATAVALIGDIIDIHGLTKVGKLGGEPT